MTTGSGFQFPMTPESGSHDHWTGAGLTKIAWTQPAATGQFRWLALPSKFFSLESGGVG
jgi:hypothetical protein